MQTQSTQDISAAVQVPLVNEGQLKVGMWITGIAASHVWEVVQVSPLITAKLPKQRGQEDHSHTWITSGEGSNCVCGMRQQPISHLLPTKVGGKARVFILSHDHQIIQPMVGEFYAGMVGGGPVIITIQGNKWSQALPIVPELHKVWGLPEGLKGFLQTGGEDQAGEIL